MSQPKRILIVDDEAHIVQVLMLKLRNAGFEVMSAADGEEGFELALKGRPDLIITDFQMPYMTGLELCKELSGQEATRDIPVLMLTARGYALDADDLAFSSGRGSAAGSKPMIREVLTKPFSPRAIVEQIQRILTEEESSGKPSGVDGRTDAADRIRKPVVPSTSVRSEVV